MTPDRKKCVDNALLNMIVTNFQPFKIVEDTGFKQFINLLNPNYCLPTRQANSKTLISLEYQKCVAKVEDLITNEADNVCLTTDCWTSRCNESYIAVTAHFVNKDFILKSILLECSEFSERHTAVNLSVEIRSIITKWKLEAKVVLVVSDNASNIKNAINTLHLRHLGCFAHTINLVVEESLKCESDLINKVKTIVVTDFRKKRIASLEKPVQASLGLLENPPSSLTTIEWTIVKEPRIVLKPFESATKVVSGENYMTASMILPIVNDLFEVCHKMKSKTFDPRIHEVIKNFQVQWPIKIAGETFAIAKHWLNNLLFPSNSTLSENTKNEIVNDVTNIIKKIKSNNIEDSTHSVEHQHSVATEADKFFIWGTLNVHASQSRPTNTSQSRAILKVQNYLDDALVPRSKDPLEWWRQNYYNFPHLSILVRMFYCQATSVPCERVFSKTGLLINDRRSNLKPEKHSLILGISMRVFIRVLAYGVLSRLAEPDISNR
ncbi:hypothetical protein QTP88_025022 [Uroleucon formosanum]